MSIDVAAIFASATVHQFILIVMNQGGCHPVYFIVADTYIIVPCLSINISLVFFSFVHSYEIVYCIILSFS